MRQVQGPLPWPMSQDMARCYMVTSGSRRTQTQPQDATDPARTDGLDRTGGRSGLGLAFAQLPQDFAEQANLVAVPRPVAGALCLDGTLVVRVGTLHELGPAACRP